MRGWLAIACLLVAGWGFAGHTSEGVAVMGVVAGVWNGLLVLGRETAKPGRFGNWP